MLTLTNGDGYYGQFSNGLCAGAGRWRALDGWEIEGEFRMDCPVKGTLLVNVTGEVYAVRYSGQCSVREREKVGMSDSKELIGAYGAGWEGSRDVDGDVE